MSINEFKIGEIIKIEHENKQYNIEVLNIVTGNNDDEDYKIYFKVKNGTDYVIIYYNDNFYHENGQIINGIKIIKEENLIKFVPPKTFDEFKARWLNNPCMTKEMLEKTQTKPIFYTPKGYTPTYNSSLDDQSNSCSKLRASGFMQVEVNFLWGYEDFIKLVFGNPNFVIWTFLQDNFDYLGGSDGDIFSLKVNRLMKYKISDKIKKYDGYLFVGINYKKILRHRLILSMTISTNLEETLVNHINSVKQDNNILNLEPSNNQQNTISSINESDNKSKKSVNKIVNDKIVNTYNTIKKAAIKNGMHTSTLVRHFEDKGHYEINVNTKLCPTEKTLTRIKNGEFKKKFISKIDLEEYKQITLIKIKTKLSKVLIFDFTQFCYYISKYTANIVRSKNEFIFKDNKLIGNFFLLKQSNNKGYKNARLFLNGKQKSFIVHRLVMITHHVSTPENYHELVVDHIDENKSNNSLTNLRWASSKENNKYVTGYKPIGYVKLNKYETIENYLLAKKNTYIEYEGVFAVAEVAASLLKVNIETIRKSCRNEKTLCGYIMDYISEDLYNKYKNVCYDMIYKKQGDIKGEVKINSENNKFSNLSECDILLNTESRCVYQYYYDNIIRSNKLPREEYITGEMKILQFSAYLLINFSEKNILRFYIPNNFVGNWIKIDFTLEVPYKFELKKESIMQANEKFMNDNYRYYNKV